MTADSSQNLNGDADLDVVVDLYKIAVEQVDRISARRATANSYFLAIHTALSAVTGVLAGATRSATDNAPPIDDLSLRATSAVGLLLSATWWLLLRSYRDLNSAKFVVINEIETRYLPVQIFAREWEILKTTDAMPWWRGRYAELGFVERVVPVLFLGVYVALGARVWF